ncbi:MAG TPA: hypothetical protein ENI23_11845 [bacterium]|nr:hypothetical protein [bacterium]
MSSSKYEFPPLLPDGIHEMTLEKLQDLCVTSFPLSKTRESTMLDIEELCNALSSNKLEAEVWVDGSFLTGKIDPMDSDIAVRLDGVAYESATKKQKQIVDKVKQKGFSNNSKCDSYVFFEYHKNDFRFSIGEGMRDYWIKQYGRSRSQEMKGIAVIRTPLS